MARFLRPRRTMALIVVAKSWGSLKLHRKSDADKKSQYWIHPSSCAYYILLPSLSSTSFVPRKMGWIFAKNCSTTLTAAATQSCQTVFCSQWVRPCRPMMATINVFATMLPYFLCAMSEGYWFERIGANCFCGLHLHVSDRDLILG